MKITTELPEGIVATAVRKEANGTFRAAVKLSDGSIETSEPFTTEAEAEAAITLRLYSPDFESPPRAPYPESKKRAYVPRPGALQRSPAPKPTAQILSFQKPPLSTERDKKK